LSATSFAEYRTLARTPAAAADLHQGAALTPPPAQNRFGELRAELFGLAYRDLKAIDPINPALEMITPTGWVPSWRDVQDLSDTLEAAKATRDMELNGEPPPNVWELGWGARSCPAAWCNIGLVTAFSGQSGRAYQAATAGSMMV
jgi:hypothetical protein